ncbi:hypothetical protein JNUCC0626_35070 [Lentzea sp. JNUCC 0626]|uniref:hypothetical protein n=1 Tax=Lentzea sp. JNUCC 0626 TaxID=3367513 RepID=UPI0037493F63
MRNKIVAALAVCLLLTGCAGDWQAEIKLKVSMIEEKPPQPIYAGSTDVWLDPVEALPDDAYDHENFHGGILDLEQIDGDVRVGDEVICLAKQRTIGALQTNTIRTELFRCRKL